MKKIYILIFFTITTSFLTAQTTVNFTEDEGFTSGVLYNQTNWDSQFTGTTWTVNPSAAGMTLVGANPVNPGDGEFQRAAWEQGFSVSGPGESITFRVDLKFLGTFGTSNNPLMKIGFSDGTDVSGGDTPFPTNNGVFLRTANFEGQLQLGNNGNGGPLSPNASLPIADCQAVGESDDLAVLVTLTLGADATSSTISAILKNLTDGTKTDIGSYESIEPLLFTAATSNIYGYFQSSSFKTTAGGGALTEIQVSSVTMTAGNVLNTDSYSISNFNFSQNPVEDTLQLRGVTAGSEISVYNVTGALVNNYVYDGNQLNLGHLSSGVYFMQVPGFTTQKLIKK